MFGYQTQHRRRVEMLVDACVTVLAFVTAYLLRSAVVGGHAALLPHLALLPVIGPMWAFLLVFFRAYRSPADTSVLELALAPMRAVGGGLVLLLTLVFLLKANDVSRTIVVSFGALDCALLVGVRLARVLAFRRALARGENRRRVLIVGTGNRAARLARAFGHKPDMGMQIVGYLDTDPMVVGQAILGARVLGTLDEITSVLASHVVDEVVLAIPRGMIGVAEKVVRACEEEGVKVRLMADLFEVNVARMALDEFEDVPLLSFEPVAQEEWKLFLKRVTDIGLTLAAMPLVLPLMTVVAAAIKWDSPGPVLFRQWRVGQNKRQFVLYKFRTMVDGSERLQAGVEHLNEASGPIFKIANDPRVTRVGRILRRTSLDELPQLFNVLRGDMSLVGPRPMSVRDVSLFDRGVQRKRFSVRPGISCLWQVSGRSDLPFSKWLELDLWYIEHWSLLLDLRILLQTIPAVLRGTGAR
jgi:exopolysaccharide biosynthesis polyprenyl glycosylphosphotransferase